MAESSYKNLSSIQSYKYYCRGVMVVTGSTKSLSFPNALRSARPFCWNLSVFIHGMGYARISCLLLGWPGDIFYCNSWFSAAGIFSEDPFLLTPPFELSFIPSRLCDLYPSVLHFLSFPDW